MKGQSQYSTVGIELGRVDKFVEFTAERNREMWAQ